jgi:hypothetical protein
METLHSTATEDSLSGLLNRITQLLSATETKVLIVLLQGMLLI